MTIDTITIAVTFVCGGVASTITIIVRDAILKNTFKYKIAALEELRAVWEKINDRQDVEITRMREEILTLREKQSNTRERVDNLYENDIKVMKEMLSTLQQQSASLDATLKGLTGWLKRIDDKLDRK